MPNPRNRHSRMRKRSRRGHDKAETPTIHICKTTGEAHLRHHAYYHEGNLFLKGKMIVKGKEEATAEE